MVGSLNQPERNDALRYYLDGGGSSPNVVCENEDGSAHYASVSVIALTAELYDVTVAEAMGITFTTAANPPSVLEIQALYGDIGRGVKTVIARTRKAYLARITDYKTIAKLPPIIGLTMMLEYSFEELIAQAKDELEEVCAIAAQYQETAGRPNVAPLEKTAVESAPPTPSI